MFVASERLNQPVYFYGDRVGRIGDFWLDSALRQVVGITICRGWFGFGRNLTIPYATVFAWQERSLSVMSLADVRETAQTVRLHSLQQQRVIIDGRPHGHLADILFGADGEVLGLSAARFGRFGSYMFTPAAIKTVGSIDQPLIVQTSRHLLAI